MDLELLRKFENQHFKLSRISIKNLSNALTVLVLILFITFINDIFLRVYFFEYNAELRLIDHLLAGLGIPIILFFIFGSFYKRCIFYFWWCSVWEIQQFFQRDYFQFEQYICDLLGIAVAICLYKRKWLRRQK